MAPRERGLFPGTVDLVILHALENGPQHGFSISRHLRTQSEGVIELQDAALYQALHRIERHGWIEAEWGVSENNRRAKFYSLTRSGRKRLTSEAVEWRRYADAVLKVLDAAQPAESGKA